jgi:hypothetical protein
MDQADGLTAAYVGVSPACRSVIAYGAFLAQRLSTLTTLKSLLTYTVTGVPSAFVM